MAFFKCKMCGGNLEVNNETVAVCQYCGTKQTLPKLDDERRSNLYDRANHFRRNNEFDKAMSVYEQILAEDKTDSEAYWSLVLCRYGIEYVEDPSSKNIIPTINRTQFTSIFDDENYKSALQYADDYQKEIYQNEASVINNIQKGILAISNQEEPFDVFICYKECDNSGRRTPDSVLATDLYYELTREGYKVFFSHITLEDKLGTAYEPYIFAALNSAKVMVVLGTKSEYFNAVWVKNEWSRYLALIKNGARKLLIPAYKDMDPYDLPEEFSHLQALDMSRLGFVQDLIRGIRKIVSPSQQVNTPVTPVANATITPPMNIPTAGDISNLIKRALLAVEDGEWSKANSYCEQILAIDLEYSQAYLVKLMIDMRVNSREGLENTAKPYDNNGNYKKAVRFGDKQLEEICKSNTERIIEKRKRRNKKIKKIITVTVSAILAVLMVSTFMLSFNFNMMSDVVSIYTCGNRTVGLKEDGTVVAIGHNRYGKCNVEGWTDIVAVSVGFDHTVGLKKDGTVVATGDNEWGQCDVDDWTDIVAISVETSTTVGLKNDGTVVAVGHNYYGQCDVDGWTDIVAVSSGDLHTVGLKRDGTVVATGLNEYGQCNVEGWTDIVSVSVSDKLTVGLRKDGTVVATGWNKYGQCNVEGWTDIVAISVETYTTVGLKNDGTVVAAGSGFSGQCDVEDWTDIVAVSAGADYTVGLKNDGTVVAVGGNYYGQCDVDGWTDIVAVSVDFWTTVGLKKDGTVVATGENDHGQCDVGRWRNPFDVAKRWFKDTF